MKKLILLLLLSSYSLMAGGYKIPEVSLNAVALSATNVAHSNGADAAYYNPANMVFMKDENTIKTDLTYIGLNDTNYQGTVSAAGPYNLHANKENFIVPALHYVSRDISGARIGISIVSTGGLSKRWSQEPAKTSAEEFTLQTIEINPSVALSIDDTIGVAIGLRTIYSGGAVKSNGTAFLNPPGVYRVVSRDMEGDSIDFGYNLALSYKPILESEIALTYRSEIDLKLKGNAKLFEALTSTTYDGGVSVSVPLPATLSLATAYTFASKTTVEFVYERTYWSAYKELDFNYSGTLSAVLTAVFDSTVAKNWKDTNTYRLGITQELNDLTLMCGTLIDETPIPDSSLSFELPGSDPVSVSFGGRYQINEKMDFGLGVLYSMKENRAVVNSSLNGKFTDTNALLISAGLEYKF
jgi:long-chain fatty acid transport protein